MSQSQELFHAILEEKRKETQSNLASTEQLLLNESLNKNLKPSPLKSLEKLVKERQSQAHALLTHFLEELRYSIAYLHEKSSEEEQGQLRIWVARLLKKNAQHEDLIRSLSEEEMIAALEGDLLWDLLETLLIAKPQHPCEKESCQVKCEPEALERANTTHTTHATPEMDDAPTFPDEEGLQVIYAIIQRCINNCEMEMVSKLYRLSLMFNPLQRDLWMEYAGHVWAFETPEKAEAI